MCCVPTSPISFSLKEIILDFHYIKKLYISIREREFYWRFRCRLDSWELQSDMLCAMSIVPNILILFNFKLRFKYTSLELHFVILFAICFAPVSLIKLCLKQRTNTVRIFFRNKSYPRLRFKNVRKELQFEILFEIINTLESSILF